MTLLLVDGGRGDADGVANGVIVDPGGAGVNAAPIIAVGPDAGSQPQVNVYDATTHKLKFSFLAYAKSFTGGVRVAVGDVNGDGYDDIIAGAGVGGGSKVRVFNGKTGNPFSGTLGGFNAFDAGFTSGVFVAAGDVNGDGKADIIVGSDQGSASPKVRVFDGSSGSLMFELMGGEAGFTGGVRVAAGDVNGDGRADIIAASGPGGAPRVCVFDGQTQMAFYDFFASDPNSKTGIQVTAGDLDGDGLADIVTSNDGSSEVHVFRGSDNTSLAQIQAFATPSGSGTRLAVGDFNGDGLGDLAAASGPGGGQVRLLDELTTDEIFSGWPYGKGFTGGLFVAASLPGGGGIRPLTVNPVVTIAATTPTTIEGSSTSAVFTVTRTGDTSQTLFVKLSYGGTATGGGSDISALPVKATILAGQTTGTATVVTVDDGSFENAETVVATIQAYVSGGGAYDVGSPSTAVVSIIDDDGPPPVVPEPTSTCSACGDPVGTAPGIWSAVPKGTAPGTGVVYASGVIAVADCELTANGFGPTVWGRAWTNGAGYANTNESGNGSVTSQLPYLIHDGSGATAGTVALIESGQTARFFDNGSTGRYFQQDTLSENTGNKEFTFTDTTGNVMVFNNFDSSLPAIERGQLKSITDSAGNTTTVTSYTTDGRPQEIQAQQHGGQHDDHRIVPLHLHQQRFQRRADFQCHLAAKGRQRIVGDRAPTRFDLLRRLDFQRHARRPGKIGAERRLEQHA